MSEYQYYEFRTIGRALSNTAREELKELSRRAIVTSNQAIYTYSYSDFGYDCKEILADHFDMMLYMNNFGTRQLMLRLPKDMIDQNVIESYCVSNVIGYSIHGESIILDIDIWEEDGGRGWIEGDGILDDLLSIRDDILNGDLRALYLAWLAAVQYYHVDDDIIEPTIPCNLKHLSSSLEALIAYFELNRDLVSVASELSQSESMADCDVDKLIVQLPEQIKNNFLIGIYNNEPDLKTRLIRSVRDTVPSDSNKLLSSSRTAGHLINLTEQFSMRREEQSAMERKETRKKELQLLAKKEPIIWKEIDNFIQLRTAKGYEFATKLLLDLKELAIQVGEIDRFKFRINAIHKEHRRLSSFMRRLHEHDLLE